MTYIHFKLRNSGFLSRREKEVPAHQADINSVQLLINHVWTLALQFRILELIWSIFGFITGLHLHCPLRYSCKFFPRMSF